MGGPLSVVARSERWVSPAGAAVIVIVIVDAVVPSWLANVTTTSRSPGTRGTSVRVTVRRNRFEAANAVGVIVKQAVVSSSQPS